MMLNVRPLGLSIALVLATAAASVGCSGGASEQQAPQTSASALTKAPVGASTHGMVKVVGDALGDVPLRPEQRTELEKLATEAEARHASMADGRKDLLAAFADQVEKGSIDRAALQPKIDRIAADMEKVRPEDQAALAKMHALLDADQRNAFVDALHAKMKAARGEHGHHEGFAKMKQLADDLKLTDDQRAQIKDLMKQSHASRPVHAMAADFKHGKEALESFRGEKFDATAMGRAADVRENAGKGADHMIGIAEKVLPILTPEQRKIAADKLREMAQKGEMGPFGH